MHWPFKRDVSLALATIALSFVIGTIVGACRPTVEEGAAFTADARQE